MYFEQETLRIANAYFRDEVMSDCINVHVGCFFMKRCLARAVPRTYYITYGYHMLFECDYIGIQTTIIHELCHLALPDGRHDKEFYSLVERKLRETALIDNDYNGWRETKFPFEKMYIEPGESYWHEQKIDFVRKRLFSPQSHYGERSVKDAYKGILLRERTKLNT